MTPKQRMEVERRLERLEAQRPPPGQSGGIPIPSAEELARLTDDELRELCEQVLATVELTPEELAMSDDELSEYCMKLVKEDQQRAGLLD